MIEGAETVREGLAQNAFTDDDMGPSTMAFMVSGLKTTVGLKLALWSLVPLEAPLECLSGRQWQTGFEIEREDVTGRAETRYILVHIQKERFSPNQLSNWVVCDGGASRTCRRLGSELPALII